VTEFHGGDPGEELPKRAILRAVQQNETGRAR
jgi:hypothetical protein